MTYLKHHGIYVNDLDKMTKFYKNCFSFYPICESIIDSGRLYDEIYGISGMTVKITKLISEYGQKTHIGEMIELIKIEDSKIQSKYKRSIYDLGLSHISIGVDNINIVISKVVACGGQQLTSIISKDLKKCCFCSDIEGNVLEIIQ